MEEQRRNQGVRDPIYLTCIAVSSGNETILLFDGDLLSISDWGAEKICQAVCPVTGIPANKVFCGATHTHSAPSFSVEMPTQIPFYELVVGAAVKAAQQALADRAPARLNSVTKNVKNMNFIRHYLMEDGTYAGSNFGNNDQGYVNHAAESDPRMMLVQFAREGKKDILLLNWQAHNDGVSFVGRYLISSSYTGEVRKTIEEKTGVHFAFFMGAAGNQNPGSCIEREKHGMDHFTYGRKLAEYAIAAMRELKPVLGTDIVTMRRIFDAPVNHSMDHMVEQAKSVVAVWEAEGKKAGDALGKTYGFGSVYQANAVIEKSQMSAVFSIALNAFRIGELAFVTCPNDTFSNVGIHVRLHGPFENTCIITGNHRYLPCMAAYEYDSYEAVTTYHTKGSAEAVANILVEMLEAIQ